MQRTFLRMDPWRIFCLLFCAASGFFSYPMYAQRIGGQDTGTNQIRFSIPNCKGVCPRRGNTPLATVSGIIGVFA